MTPRARPCLALLSLAACTSAGSVVMPDASYDAAGLYVLDRTVPNGLDGGALPVAVQPDGAVLGTVLPDGAVVASDGAVVGTLAGDGAVLAADGAVLGGVRDGGTDGAAAGDGSVPNDLAEIDGATADGGAADGAAGDASWPVEGDGAVMADAFLPDGAAACAGGWRACGPLCVAPGTCCADSDCTGGRACSRPGGQCSCRENTRMCGARCIAESGCCADSDCPTGFLCPTVGSICRDSAGCVLGTRSCNGSCIAAGACCTTADCADGVCPGAGAFCSGMNRCARGSRACGSQCIPTGTCCDAADCPAGFVCPTPGAQCGCPRGQRLCGATRCVAADACCTDDDCPVTSCPTPGMACAPVPPRIAIARWGIDRLDGDAGAEGSTGQRFRHYELTTTTAESDALTRALGASGEMARATLDNPRYLTVYGPGVCPRGTAALYAVDRGATTAWPRVDHVLTVSQMERDFLVRDGWRSAQVGCAVAASGVCPAGTVAVLRYQLVRADVEAHRFVLSADAMEASRAGFLYDGIAFCAW